MPHKSLGRSLAKLDRGIAVEVGTRIKAARLAAGLTQARLAEGRYTKAYISALENGLSKPSLAALTFIATRLSLPVTHFLEEATPAWSRLEADLRLASGDWAVAADAYRDLLAGATHATRRAELERGLAEALYRMDQFQEALRVASSSAAAFDAIGAAADAAAARYWMAGAFIMLDNETEARSILRGLLDQLRAGLKVEPDWEVRILIALANADGRGGEEARALGYLEEARALVGKVDDRRRAVFLNSLAVSYRERGDLEAAVRLANQAMARYRELFLEGEVALLENELALNYMGMGSFERARSYATAADERMDAIGDHRNRAHVVETRSQIALAEGDLAGAEAIASEALELATREQNHKAAVSATLTLARIARKAGDPKIAAERMEAAATLAREHARPQQLRDVLTEWSDVLSELGDDKGAYRLSREALHLGRS
jgi:transcriptional regulator with XRE-family HTH domain